MRFLLLLVLSDVLAFAQIAVPQAVAWVHSPDQAAFAGVTPKLDFPPEVMAKIKPTEAGQTFRLIVTHEAVSSGTAPAPVSITVTFDELGLKGVTLGLPPGYKVKATGGVTIQLLVASGNPVVVPTSQ